MKQAFFEGARLSCVCVCVSVIEAIRVFWEGGVW